MSERAKHKAREPWFWTDRDIQSFIRTLDGKDAPYVVSVLEHALLQGAIEPARAITIAKATIGTSPWISEEDYDPTSSADWHVAKTLAWIATRSKNYVLDFDHEALNGRSTFAVAMRPPPEGIKSPIGAWDHWKSVPANIHPPCELATYVLIDYAEGIPPSFIHQGGLGEALRLALANGDLTATNRDGERYKRQQWRDPAIEWGSYFWPRTNESRAEADGRYEEVLLDRDEILKIWPPAPFRTVPATEQLYKRKVRELAELQAEKNAGGRVILAQVERELVDWAEENQGERLGKKRVQRYLNIVRENYADRIKPGAPIE